MLIEGLYTVLNFSREDEKITALVQLNKDHAVFKGHFPDNPVMPGVCMIQMVKELTEKTTGKELLLSNASNIKFMKVINPEENDTILLSIAISEDQGFVKVKNTASFQEKMALKLSATFKIIDSK